MLFLTYQYKTVVVVAVVVETGPAFGNKDGH